MTIPTPKLLGADAKAYIDSYLHRPLLRFMTCGSVDDGKSTLIGRLLYESSPVCRWRRRSRRSPSVPRAPSPS
jgi:hypothetical protein